jgi:hypothetical protein
VHKRESQIYILAEHGEVVEQRIRTEPGRFAAVLGTRPHARILIEASTDRRTLHAWTSLVSARRQYAPSRVDRSSVRVRARYPVSPVRCPAPDRKPRLWAEKKSDDSGTRSSANIASREAPRTRLFRTLLSVNGRSRRLCGRARPLSSLLSLSVVGSSRSAGLDWHSPPTPPFSANIPSVTHSDRLDYHRSASIAAPWEARRD